MDPLTHLLITRKFVSPEPATLLAGLAPDVPFYLTYPAWVIYRGQLRVAFSNNEWPQAPQWMYTLHHLFHSLPMLLLVSAAGRLITGRWPLAGVAWGLHILIDIPTHSRRHWAPQFLWPFSPMTVDGLSWAEVVIPVISRLFQQPRGEHQ
jgi:hypothetical protein